MPTALGLTNDTERLTPSEKAERKKNGGGRSSSKHSSREGNKTKAKGALDTIFKRNEHDAKEMDTLLWRAFTDTDPSDALEYIADDCAMLNPFMTGTLDAVSGKKEIKEKMESGVGATWTQYSMESGSYRVVEVGLMAVSTLYRCSLKGDDGRAEVRAVVSSTWRQTAGADWLLCNQLVMKAA